MDSLGDRFMYTCAPRDCSPFETLFLAYLFLYFFLFGRFAMKLTLVFFYYCVDAFYVISVKLDITCLGTRVKPVFETFALF